VERERWSLNGRHEGLRVPAWAFPVHGG
jgi:hypothetical protein